MVLGLADALTVKTRTKVSATLTEELYVGTLARPVAEPVGMASRFAGV
jgi:hypothetical protein